MKKIIALFLMILMTFCLFSCGNEENTDDNNDIQKEQGMWYSDVDFHGESIAALLSQNRPVTTSSQAFHFGTKYIASNQITADTVMNQCYERNKLVANYLNVKMTNEVDEKEWLSAELEKYSMLSVTPYDVIYLPACQLSGHLVNGQIMNINSDEPNSYFDFNEDDWYVTFMSDMSLDNKRYYVMAGDYFINYLQGENAIFMNTTYYQERVQRAMDMTLEDFCDVIMAREFDYDLFMDIIHNGYETTSTDGQLTTDDNIGLMCNCSYWMYPFIYSTGETCFERSETGMLSLKENITPFQDMVETICEVYHGRGTLMNAYGDLVRPQQGEYAKQFAHGNVLFVAGFTIGNMEDDVFTRMSDKLVIPYPLYNDQEDYLTYYDTLSDVAVVMKNTNHFSAVSAYYQLGNEKSHDILSYYYENGLKFKYADDPLVSNMLDLIRKTISSPFEEMMCERLYIVAGFSDIRDSMNQFFLNGVFFNTPSEVTTRYAGVYQAYKQALEDIIKAINKSEQ